MKISRLFFSAILLTSVSLTFSAHAQSSSSFDQSRLLKLLDAAKMPKAGATPPALPVVQSTAPKAPSPPPTPGARDQGARFCETPFEELEKQIAALGNQIILNQKQMAGIREETRAIKVRLRDPENPTTCVDDAVADLKAVATRLEALSVTDLRAGSENAMFCSTAKSEELQLRKQQAVDENNNTRMRRLAALESRLIASERQATSLAENSNALSREVARYVSGVNTSISECAPIDDF